MMLSVVMPIYNLNPDLARMTQRNLGRMWDARTVPLEVIGVENGSPCEVEAAVSTWIHWPQNRGIAPAWNAGLAQAHGDVIAFVTTSTAVEPGWDKALRDAARSGAIAFPLTDEGDGPRKHRDGTGVAGWCWAMSRETAERIGPFDESFSPAWYEDTDYFYRATQLGIPLVSVPAAVVKHARSSTTSKLSNWPLLFMSQRLRFAWKHGLDPDAPPPFWRTPLPDWRPPT